MRPLLFAALLITVSASAQQQSSQNEPFTLSVSSHLVIETVSVTDKSGHSIDGLTAKDFAITEDGAPQTIRYFEHQQLPAASTAPPANTTPEQVKIYDTLSRTHIQPENPG